jgi:hypothetical protein
MDRHGQEAQINRQLIIPRIPPPRQFHTFQRLQLLARAKLIERALSLNEQRAVFAEMRELQDHVRHPETRGPEGDCAVVDRVGRGSEEGMRSLVRRKERCWRGKKASMDQPCVRSIVCRRRVGGGARSSEIIHWIMGSTPVQRCGLRMCGWKQEVTYPRDPRVRERY